MTIIVMVWAANLRQTYGATTVTYSTPSLTQDLVFVDIVEKKFEFYGYVRPPRVYLKSPTGVEYNLFSSCGAKVSVFNKGKASYSGVELALAVTATARVKVGDQERSQLQVVSWGQCNDPYYYKEPEVVAPFYLGKDFLYHTVNGSVWFARVMPQKPFVVDITKGEGMVFLPDMKIIVNV